MEVVINKLGDKNSDRFGLHVEVQAIANLIERTRLIHIEMGDLATSMDTGIRTASAMNCYILTAKSMNSAL